MEKICLFQIGNFWIFLKIPPLYALLFLHLDKFFDKWTSSNKSSLFNELFFIIKCLKLLRMLTLGIKHLMIFGKMAGLFGLFVSTSYIGLTFIIAWWARKLVDKLSIQSEVKKTLLLEAIATWELCASCFELIIIADNYGVYMYAVYLFLMTIWWSRNWGDATACPYTHFEDVAEGKQWLGIATLKILAQLAGGLLTYRYSQYLWSLEVSQNHRGRAYEACTADLQVTAILGAFIEGVATCLCRLASRLIAEIEPKYGTELDAFVGTSLVVAAFNYSGGYFNPALATALKFGCEGHTPFQHFLVYWIGSTVGAISAVFLFKHPSIRSKINAITGKKDV